MDSQAIALVIAAGGLVLGLARLIISILTYRLNARRKDNPSAHTLTKDHDATGSRRTSVDL